MAKGNSNIRRLGSTLRHFLRISRIVTSVAVFSILMGLSSHSFALAYISGISDTSVISNNKRETIVSYSGKSKYYLYLEVSYQGSSSWVRSNPKTSSSTTGSFNIDMPQGINRYRFRRCSMISGVPAGCDYSAIKTHQTEIVKAVTKSFEYDELGRLTFVKDPLNGNRDYDYDPAGNRTQVFVGATTDSENPDAEPDYTAYLPAPTNLYTSAVATGVYTSSWSAVTGATYYIYRVNDTSGTEYQVTSTQVTYSGTADWVKACNASICSAISEY